MIAALPFRFVRFAHKVVAELCVRECVAAVDAPVRRQARRDIGFEATRPHVACLIEEASRPRECDVLADDVKEGRVQLKPVARQVEALAEFQLTATLGFQRGAVGLRLRQWPKRVGNRAIEIDGRRRLIDQPDAARERVGSRRRMGPSVSTPSVDGIVVARCGGRRRSGPPTIAFTRGPSVR